MNIPTNFHSEAGAYLGGLLREHCELLVEAVAEHDFVPVLGHAVERHRQRLDFDDLGTHTP